MNLCFSNDSIYGSYCNLYEDFSMEPTENLSLQWSFLKPESEDFQSKVEKYNRLFHEMINDVPIQHEQLKMQFYDKVYHSIIEAKTPIPKNDREKIKRMKQVLDNVNKERQTFLIIEFMGEAHYPRKEPLCCVLF